MKLSALFVVIALTLARGDDVQVGAEDSRIAASEGKSTPPTAPPAKVDRSPRSVASARETSAELELVKGREFLELDRLGSLALSSDRGKAHRITFGERAWPADEVLFLRFPGRTRGAGPTNGSGSDQKAWLLLFRNGDTLRGKIVSEPPAGGQEEDEDNLHFFAPSLGARPVRVALSAITALVPEASLYGRPGRLRDYPQARAQFLRRLQRMKISGDVVLLRQGTGGSGAEGTRIEGIVEGLTNERLKISSERLGEVEVSYARLRAVVLVQLEDEEDEEDRDNRGKPDAARRPLDVFVRLQDGGNLTARLETLRVGRARLAHPTLGEIEIALEAISEIAFTGGRVSYLSDHEPIHAHEYPGPLFNETDRYAYKRDTNVLYGPLRMSERIYRKGLGVHSYSLLEYALAEDDALFQATIGLDDSARPFSTAAAAADVASVVFRVKVDGKLLFEKAMTWNETPVPVDVPTRGGKKLSLEVDFGGVRGSMNSTLDRANWADARLVKTSD